ncbi:pyridoxal kinase PdxY [Neiella sp. HB171785]|uniref:Pyridoxal kinase PdxY n=1 Tax=Neiella litorisoli TaxID=2771431 RepID=A0A8J6UPQ3_9GAMM|nr:pyridoxal kinase PdxY [Neiella litorisoli]MBD1389132.1 pyridoxal kinase PdxY [Neiella litorisoli]
MKGIISIQSHVVYGHAGNSAAVFPMQRMGLEVWPIHTVQFSNHTQYVQGWTGQVFAAEQIHHLVIGINAIGKLSQCQAVLSGYLGSAEQCQSVLSAVNKVKQANPDALYICDPVMGDPDKGCIVAPEVHQQMIQLLMPQADVIVPNQFELSQLAEQTISSLSEAVHAARRVISKGPEIVLVKHLHCLADHLFSMLLVTADEAYLIQRPKLEFDRAPVGVGDLISGLFSAQLVTGKSPVAAFEHTHNAVFDVLKTTQALHEWELQTIAAQQQLVTPQSQFKAQLLPKVDAVSARQFDQLAETLGREAINVVID